MSPATSHRVREKTSRRKAEIVDEAIRVIGEHGYNGFTIQQLAVRCNTSNANLIYHFGSKDQLLLALLDELERREALASTPLVVAAGQSRGLTPDARAALIQVFRGFVERFVDQAELGRLTLVLQSEAMAPSHRAHAWFQRREQMALELFTRLISPWTLTPDATARRLLALKDGLGRQWLASNGGFDLVAEWEGVITDVLRSPPRSIDDAETERPEEISSGDASGAP